MTECETKLKTRHNFKDFLYWTTCLLVPIITACVAILNWQSVIGIVSYILICIACVLVLYRFFCTHCPHYTREDKRLKCMFFWGVPKIFKPNPGPMNIFEKLAVLLAVLLIVFFPFYWLSRQVGLFVIYILSIIVLGATIRRNECPRCIHRNCMLNCAPAETETPEE
ncbi:MAG: hypothetical protein GY859_16345 [Desulfobacterales bacterium]|nr:hypothetical protein [Desulfobacterales bacterium]